MGNLSDHGLSDVCRVSHARGNCTSLIDPELADQLKTPSYCSMTNEVPPKITSADRKRLAAEQTNEVARLTAEAEKKARDEKTARLRAIRLAKPKD